MKLLTPTDIAELLQVSYETALNFIKTSGIPHIMVGRQYRVSDTAFETFIATAQTQTVNLEKTNIYNNCNPPAPKKLKMKGRT